MHAGITVCFRRVAGGTDDVCDPQGVGGPKDMLLRPGLSGLLSPGEPAPGPVASWGGAKAELPALGGSLLGLVLQPRQVQTPAFQPLSQDPSYHEERQPH